MKLLCDELNSVIGDNPFTNSARAFRESFVASRFAEYIGASHIKLLKEADAPMPDFAIKLHDEILNYEITELDDPKRQRGREYQTGQFSQKSTIDRSQFIEQIRYLSDNKARKKYSEVHGLIIWTNIFSDDSVSAIDAQQASSLASSAFSQVWLRDGEAFTQLWQFGLPSGDSNRRVA